MNVRSRIFFHALVIALATVRAVPATIDTLYRAVRTCGIWLYWVPVDGVSPDTVSWDALRGPLPDNRLPRLTGFSSVVRELDSTGWKVYRVKNCSAMSLALLVSLGYDVAILTQWHASLRNKVKVPLPGMSQKPMRHSLVSDLQWERVERASIESSGDGAYRVTIHCAQRGLSRYDGRDDVVGANRQVLGIEGVLIRIPELSFEEDLNIRRTVFAIVLIVPGDRTVQQIVSTVEKAMDKRKLDLSYRAPIIEPVAAPRVLSRDTIAAVPYHGHPLIQNSLEHEEKRNNMDHGMSPDSSALGMRDTTGHETVPPQNPDTERGENTWDSP